MHLKKRLNKEPFSGGVGGIGLNVFTLLNNYAAGRTAI
jgi:hypothetical protein